jgi:hypothetical protein
MADTEDNDNFISPYEFVSFSSSINLDNVVEKDEFSYYNLRYKEESTHNLLLLLGSLRAKKTKLIPELIAARTLTRRVLFEKYKYDEREDYYLTCKRDSEEQISERLERCKQIIKALKSELAKREHRPNSRERKEIRKWKAFEKRHR